MERVFVLALVLPALVAVGVVVLVVVLLVTRSHAAPVPAAAVLGPSTWNAQLGAGPGSSYGTFQLADGWLGFTADGAAEPAWVVPCAQLWVAKKGVGPFTITSVRLHGPMGEVACNVSREHINRFATNSLKSFREAGYADQFVAAVHAQGARVG